MAMRSAQEHRDAVGGTDWRQITEEHLAIVLEELGLDGLPDASRVIASI